MWDDDLHDELCEADGCTMRGPGYCACWSRRPVVNP